MEQRAQPYLPEIENERILWDELLRLCRLLDADEVLVPGYFRDPDWTVKDLVAHIGTWLAEAEIQLFRIDVGTYVDEPLDVDAMNAEFLAAMRDQTWTTCWNQMLAARPLMLGAWMHLAVRSEPADRWVRKSGAEHYAEHLPRLREWVAELRGETVRGEAVPG
ncbi:MAG TPA: hypothetical protein VNM34_09440 [Verrucomicrobiae bacterium]|nr:hypothetical protein [Verrucomicrobiae bacterium]